jgi:hypothetical protein
VIDVMRKKQRKERKLLRKANKIKPKAVAKDYVPMPKGNA